MTSPGSNSGGFALDQDPVLLLHGRPDRSVPAGHGEWLAAEFRASTENVMESTVTDRWARRVSAR
jgi:predicted esterase